MRAQDGTVRHTKAKGTLSPEGHNRVIAIRFEPDIFELIAKEAYVNNRSFAEQVRIYVGLGMEHER
jgi:hypothetical protein